MSEKHFIKERLGKLEDISAYHKETQIDKYGIGDLVDNLLPILKDLIEENMELKNEIKNIKEELLEPDIKK